jgi:hypothetical protein
VFELLGESSVLELEPELEDLVPGVIEGFDLLLVLFVPFVFPFVVEPLKFVGCLPDLQFPVFPPTFFFNQSRPLFTALSATCLVTLFTLFARVSNMFEHGLLGDLVLICLVLLVGLLFILLFVGLDFVLAGLDFEDLAVICGVIILLLPFLTATGLVFTLFTIPPPPADPTFGLIFSFTEPSFAPFFFPLQKLLRPFFKH